ncbi:MAG: alpha/beta hydrolase [Bdellovibrionales bacterium]|nr:alpha/beta hydrolase [Bdellovibrionales bacterium]
MKTALLLHGMPSKDEYFEPNSPSGSNCHWFPWLQKQLIINEYQVWAPDIFHSYQPDYEIWKQEIERYDFNEQSLLVGHSCGGGFLLKWLSENSLCPKKLILVAPWIDPSRERCPEFFECQFDLQLHERTEIIIYGSDNDHPEIQSSIANIKAVYPHGRYRNFPGYGHFCSHDIGSDEFPELLDDLLAEIE